MLLKKGIVRKTFFFSALLIVIVILLSFAAMYFLTPGYYLQHKSKALFSNVMDLTNELQAATTEEECAALISDFSAANNVIILSFDQNGMLLPAVSTPFLGMRGETTVIMRERSDEGDQRYAIRIQNRQIEAGEASEVDAPIYWAQKDDTTGNAIRLMSKVDTSLIDQITVTGTLQPIDEAMDVILSLFPYVLVIAVAMGLVLSWIYAKQISKPILRISGATLKMQQMEPGVVSGIRTNDELGALSENLDVLYDKLLENIAHLKEEMEKASRMERSKTDLMQNASHELKTPIAALSGMIEGMLDSVGAYADREKYLVRCKEQTDKLSQLVAEILGASKADIVGAEHELSDTRVDEMIENAIAENSYQISEKHLRLKRDLPPTIITTDPDIFYRAVSNLVSNAVCYTPSGGAIRIAVTGEGAERCIVFENECETISPEELPKLFEPFYTRSYSRDKTKSGTGLGLYIVKRSLEQLDIQYEASISELGFKICFVGI